MDRHTIRMRCPKKRMRCLVAPTSCSSARRPWPRSNSCNRSGSTTAISWGSAKSEIRLSDCRKKGRVSPFRENRSGVAFTESKPSTCSAAESTSLCRACPLCDGWASSDEAKGFAVRRSSKVRSEDLITENVAPELADHYVSLSVSNFGTAYSYQRLGLAVPIKARCFHSP